MSVERIEIIATLEIGAETLHLEAKQGKRTTDTTRIHTHLPPPHQDEKLTPVDLMHEAEHWALNSVNDGNILLDDSGWHTDGFGVWRRHAYVHIRED